MDCRSFGMDWDFQLSTCLRWLTPNWWWWWWWWWWWLWRTLVSWLFIIFSEPVGTCLAVAFCAAVSSNGRQASTLVTAKTTSKQRFFADVHLISTVCVDSSELVYTVIKKVYGTVFTYWFIWTFYQTIHVGICGICFDLTVFMTSIAPFGAEPPTWKYLTWNIFQSIRMVKSSGKIHSLQPTKAPR